MDKLLRASSDFNAVRSGQVARFQQFDIDLSLPRAGDGIGEFGIAGNFIYVDPAGNAGGSAFLFLEDLTNTSSKISVYPGFTCRFAFTRIRVENIAQPGKTLRLMVGTDVDFSPISSAGVAVLNPTTFAEAVESNIQHYQMTLTPNSTGTIFTSAQNPRGVHLHLVALNVGTGQQMLLYISPTGSLPSGSPGSAYIDAVLTSTYISRQENMLLPPGVGLYCLNVGASNNSTIIASFAIL